MRLEGNQAEKRDWIAALRQFSPKTAEEQTALSRILSLAEQERDGLLFRSRTEGHMTCSGFVMNRELNKVLMVYHHIYDSFCWTGGHADGCGDFPYVAEKEVREETGVQKPYLQSGSILTLDILPVKAHKKNGKPVDAHVHYNVTYGLIADERETLRVKPDENSAVQWIAVEQLESICKEPQMLPIYEKCIQRMRQRKKRQDQVLMELGEPLLQWYPSHARELPWRQTKEPYPVWLSEIMLQQTRVEAVKGYYQRFLERFPTVSALADAAQDQVNKCWEGLGYYSRAANLHRAAVEIMEQHGGKFPETYEAVRNLPGVGEYTAGAICSICYGLPTPAVDGNVLRVAARVTDSFCAIDETQYKKAVTGALEQLYRSLPGKADQLTQSLMELGATVCLPNGAPLCEDCPLSGLCLGYAGGDVQRLPRRTPKKPRRKEQRTVFLLQCDGKFAVRKRTEPGLLHNMWEFPNVSGKLSLEEMAQQVSAWGCQPLELERTEEKKHIFTHVEWEMLGVTFRCGEMPSGFVWKSLGEIQQVISLPTAFRQFLSSAPV